MKTFHINADELVIGKTNIKDLVTQNNTSLNNMFDLKADKATTLAGYGITDAKIEGGVITLGSNTIIPLTAHQSLANYSTLSNTLKDLSVSGTTITYTKGDGTTGTITTQDTNTTYSAGSNITLTGTTFSLTKANVVAALGYTPPASDTNTTYSAGTGLSLSGTTINHASSVSAGTAGTSSATSGATVAIPYVTVNASGHVTAYGTHTHTVSSTYTLPAATASTLGGIKMSYGTSDLTAGSSSLSTGSLYFVYE